MKSVLPFPPMPWIDSNDNHQPPKLNIPTGCLSNTYLPTSYHRRRHPGRRGPVLGPRSRHGRHPPPAAGGCCCTGGGSNQPAEILTACCRVVQSADRTVSWSLTASRCHPAASGNPARLARTPDKPGQALTGRLDAGFCLMTIAVVAFIDKSEALR